MWGGDAVRLRGEPSQSLYWGFFGKGKSGQGNQFGIGYSVRILGGLGRRGGL